MDKVRTRFFEIMRRHVSSDDAELSDRDLVEAVYKRWHYWYYDVPLIDPNE